MKNRLIFVLCLIFCIAFLSLVYSILISDVSNIVIAYMIIAFILFSIGYGAEPAGEVRETKTEYP